ncbi:MAG TPA: 3-methyl-2-oxobutanoate hydroxymethyltransferase [Bryobacteraceae bacterium]|jgi:3-methyl-2-oxobutanoate hydroxymethyltransferase
MLKQKPSAADFLRAKTAGRKLSMVTCYDHAFARLLARSAVDAILVGDSAGMVMHGHPSTLSVTVDLVRLHTEAVVRGAGGKFIVADMPFLSYRRGCGPALDAAFSLMSVGAGALKLEGVRGHEDAIARLIESGIPVMGHLGMQPQSVNAYGGFRVQGQSDAAAQQILRDAKTLEDLGAFSVVLECIPSSIAAEITQASSIPTIGIGAGPHCDGQVLVLHDLLGMNPDFHPRFVRPFLDGAQQILGAISAFDSEVKAGTFPAAKESYE